MGTPTPRTTGTVNWDAQIEGVGFTGLSIVDNDAGNSGAYLHLAASNAGSVGGNTALSNGYGIGTIIWSGADGTDVNTQGAYIGAIVDGAVGSNVMPTKLYFSTNPGGASPLKRLEIAPNGALKLFNSPGIDFSGIQTNTAGMTSETLDSYEQGTFTPILRGSGTAGTYVAGRASVGRYVRIGNMVTATADFNAGSFSGSTGAIQITGLPFTVSGVGISANGDIPYETAASSMMYNVTFNSSYRQSWYLNPNASTAYGIETRSGTTWVDWASSSFHASSLYLTMTFVYTAA